MNVSILPAFPPELEREIFEIAAIEIPQSMPQLVRVARRVCVWIEPLLCRTLILAPTWKLDPDVLRLVIEINPSKFAKYLQNFLDCHGIRNLTFSHPVPEILPALEAMKLHRFSVSLSHLLDRSPVDPARPLFRTLTHLDLWDSDTEFLTELPFDQFPALTHLSVNDLNTRYSPFLTSILRHCTRLCVLVNMRLSSFAPGLEAYH
ncbi:hypothetical protein C8J57DRAFT_1517714 [Mycena rebaudengoi]|nr:hypothetical protein C8J57DRAFT_1517714 [Mycena rebaudengoi]